MSSSGGQKSIVTFTKVKARGWFLPEALGKNPCPHLYQALELYPVAPSAVFKAIVAHLQLSLCFCHLAFSSVCNQIPSASYENPVTLLSPPREARVPSPSPHHSCKVPSAPQGHIHRRLGSGHLWGHHLSYHTFHCGTPSPPAAFPPMPMPTGSSAKQPSRRVNGLSSGILTRPLLPRYPGPCLFPIRHMDPVSQTEP